MEQVERRDLPGNDASWFRALLTDEVLVSPPGEEAPHDTALDSRADVDTAIEGEDSQDLPAAAVTVDTSDSDLLATEDDATIPAVEMPYAEDPTGVDDTQDAVADGTHSVVTEEVDSPLITAVPPIEPDESPVETTSEMVGQLWTAREDSPLDTWEPDDMNRTIKSSRSFRWTSLIGVIAVLALIGVGLVLLPSITRNRADDHLDMFSSVLGDLRGELPDTQQSLESATDPVTTPAEFEGLATQLTVLTAKASAVDEAAQAKLPATPPFTSSEPIDELEPIRQRLEPLGTVANAIQRRIANLAQYRILMTGFLALPDLPDTADSATQAELRVTLAAAQAESASILADLPSDVSLDAHRELARTINERFATWQVDYLEALRAQDAAEARTLLAELDTMLTELDNELVTPLAQIRRQTDTDLIELARSIDAVVLLINGNPQTP